MEQENSVSTPHEAPAVRVIPLPYALYESDGLIFGLYDGGQPYQPALIRWEKLKPVTVVRKDVCNQQVNVEESGNPLQGAAMKSIDFLKALREAFHHELSAKTGWGREEVKAAFERAISNALAQNTTIE